VYERRFLNERIEFIRQLYNITTAPYIECKRQIEAEEEPYSPPPSYIEDGEPHFLNEWLEANESILVIGCLSVSMLSGSFHLYFKTWEKRLGVPIDKPLMTVFKKSGWLKGYMAYFSKHFGVEFNELPADLDILQEVILLRNRLQHPEELTTNIPSYSKDDLDKLRHPFFIDDSERALFSDLDDQESTWLIPPSFTVTSEKLYKAIAEVQRFTEWLEGEH
jgi:hypothetical protein